MGTSVGSSLLKGNKLLSPAEPASRCLVPYEVSCPVLPLPQSFLPDTISSKERERFQFHIFRVLLLPSLPLEHTCYSPSSAWRQ